MIYQRGLMCVIRRRDVVVAFARAGSGLGLLRVGLSLGVLPASCYLLAAFLQRHWSTQAGPANRLEVRLLWIVVPVFHLGAAIQILVPIGDDESAPIPPHQANLISEIRKYSEF